MKKKLFILLAMMLMGISTVLGAVPTELDCSVFANETTQICTDLDQVGTGISLMAYKLRLGLPGLLLALAFVTVTIAVVYAIVHVIKKSIGSATSGKFK